MKEWQMILKESKSEKIYSALGKIKDEALRLTALGLSIPFIGIKEARRLFGKDAAAKAQAKLDAMTPEERKEAAEYRKANPPEQLSDAMWYYLSMDDS